MEIKRSLRWFEMASGLKVNFDKSSLWGINLDHGVMENMGSRIGCEVGMAPFSYLGLNVGFNHHNSWAWNNLVEKVKKKLARWNGTGFLDGRFSTKEAYKGLAKEETESVDADDHRAYQLLWMSAATRRFQSIGWKILKKRLPTRDELKKRGIIPDSQDIHCPCCGNEDELVLHLFFGCSFARKIWSEIYKWTDTPMVPHLDPKYHLEMHSSILGRPNSDELAVSIWIATVGTI
ncbi:hypothetical protein ACS0TY_006754 [Phlomoides rotata]